MDRYVFKCVAAELDQDVERKETPDLVQPILYTVSSPVLCSPDCFHCEKCVLTLGQIGGRAWDVINR